MLKSICFQERPDVLTAPRSHSVILINKVIIAFSDGFYERNHFCVEGIQKESGIKKHPEKLTRLQSHENAPTIASTGIPAVCSADLWACRFEISGRVLYGILEQVSASYIFTDGNSTGTESAA